MRDPRLGQMAFLTDYIPRDEIDRHLGGYTEVESRIEVFALWIAQIRTSKSEGSSSSPVRGSINRANPWAGLTSWFGGRNRYRKKQSWQLRDESGTSSSDELDKVDLIRLRSRRLKKAEQRLQHY